MKKINIQLNKASIEQAINHLKFLRKQIPKMMDEFLEFACRWLIKRANFYIESADLGNLVKLKLQQGWSYNISGGVAKLSNTAVVVKKRRYADEDDTVPLAVLVEFGVGIVGQGNAHPNATKAGYEYNIDTDHKKENGMWYFWTNSNELDIPLSAVEDFKGFDDHRGAQGKRMVVGTRGAQGVMYAYNALVDAQIDLQNPNGEFANELRNLKVRYGLA